MHSNTSETTHWRYSVLIPYITSQHHKWHIHSSWRSQEGNNGENALKALGEKWVQYIIQINANEGFDGEESGEKIFMDRMGEFYGNKGIRLMEKNEIDYFIRLLKNLRGEII